MTWLRRLLGIGGMCWVGHTRNRYLDRWWVRCSLPPWGWIRYFLIDRPRWKNSYDPEDGSKNE